MSKAMDEYFAGLTDSIVKAVASTKYPQNSAPKEGGPATQLETGLNKSLEDRVNTLTKALADLTAELAKAKGGSGSGGVDGDPDEDDADKKKSVAKLAEVEELVKSNSDDISELAKAVEGLAEGLGKMNARTRVPLRKSIEGQDGDDGSDTKTQVQKSRGGAFDGFVKGAYYNGKNGGGATVILR